MKTSDRIIVPLDVDTEAKAEAILDELALNVGAFKVGYEFGYSVGWNGAVSRAMAGGPVMLDLKLNDIAKTCAAATRAVAQWRPWGITMHANAGDEAIGSVKAVLEAESPSTKLICVTVLTSIGDDEAKAIYNTYNARSAVESLAVKAQKAGADAIVCSPVDLNNKYFMERVTIPKICPGIRPEWSVPDGQTRFTTPAEAIKFGADYLVIGSPILKPPEHIGNPIHAVERIVAEIDG